MSLERHLADLKRAAEWLYEDDPEWVEGGCADMSGLLLDYATKRGMRDVRLVVGMAARSKNAKKGFPHVWLEVGGERFDPSMYAQGDSLGTYVEGVELGRLAVAGSYIDRSCDVREDNEFRLNALLRAMLRPNPSGRGGTGRRARLKIEFLDRSASSTLAAPTTNPAIDLKPFHVEPQKTTRRRARGVFDDYQYDDEVSAARQRGVQQVLDRNGFSVGDLLGTGSFASVYELKGHPERVVKVTNDPTDAAVMAEVVHAPNVPGLPRVYGVYQTPAQSYVVVMERLFPLSPGEKADVSNIVSEYERGWSIAQGWVPRTKTASGFEKAFVESLTYLRRLGFYFSDIHMNNVMKRRDGSYVISDLGMASVAGNKRGSRDVPLINPADLKGRSIPERYLAGLPAAVKKARVRELTRSRDAYGKGDYSELPSDRIARQMGLVKKSAYSEVAEARGIEWRGDEAEMARRVCAHYKVKCTPAVATAIRSSFNKGLAAWKSGGHRPGATAQNWAVARVASLVVGGKTSLTADRKEFASFPAPLQKAIAAGRPDVVRALLAQGRENDAAVVHSGV